MKRAKTVTVVAAACALALALAGCGGNAASSSSSAASDSAASGSSAAATDTSAASESSSAATQAQSASILINTDGMGVIGWSYENEEPEFDEDTPVQSAVVNDAYGQTIHIEARDYDEYEGWHFTKWTKDGADFSTEKRIDVEVDGDAEYIAVFEIAEEE